MRGFTAWRLILRYASIATGWAIAGFAVCNLLGGLVVNGFDANVVWLPHHSYTWWPTQAMLGGMAVLLAWSLLRPACSMWRFVLTQAALLFFAIIALVDGIRFYRLLAVGEIACAVPIPFAVLVVLALASQMIRIGRSWTASPKKPCPNPEVRIMATTACLAGVALIFLMGQFFLFGSIDHRRKADCIVVMGAGVLPGGRPSLALYDRTRTGCALYREGLSDRIILSGGLAEKLNISEPQVMAVLAEELGVPSSAIIRDEQGVNTYNTVLNVRRIMHERGWRTVLVVSHDYHLSRTWLAFRRAGITVWTVPAKRSRVTFNDIYTTCRETAAWPYYYFRPLWQSYEVEDAS